MTRIYYIISVSAKGILPKRENEPRRMLELERKLGFVHEVSSSWDLSDKGFDERIYRASRPESHPLTSKEAEEFKSIFDKENRILEIYRLEKI